MLGVIQNLTTFIVSNLGLSLITAAMAIGFVCVMMRAMYWHTLGEMALAGAGLVGVAAFVNTVF